MKRIIGLTATAMCMAAALLPKTAAAGDTTYVISDDQWHFDVIVYGWLPTISGKTRFPLGDGDESSIDSSKILDSLKMVFFGGFSANKGDWGGFADFIDLDIGNHKSTTVTIDTRGGPVAVGSANVELDLKAFVSTVAGTYAIAHGPQLGMQLLAGARVLDVKGTLALDLTGGPLGGQSFNGEPKHVVWNGIVGARGQLNFGSDLKWFVPLYLDVGAGDSQLTWQAMTGVGYSFGWGEVALTYRYLDFQGKSDAPVQDLSVAGPLIGASFHF